MVEAYTVAKLEQMFIIYPTRDSRPWWAYYTDYQGTQRCVYVEGRDEMAAFMSAMKQLKRLQKRADKRRTKKEQTS